MAEIEAEAAKHGLQLRDNLEMPANNLFLVFKKLATEKAGM